MHRLLPDGPVVTRARWYALAFVVFLLVVGYHVPEISEPWRPF